MVSYNSRDSEPGRATRSPAPPADAPAVLQVLPSLDTGGAERGAVDVAAALVEAGWRAFVVSSGGRMVRELERSGAKHITLPVHSKNPFVMRRNAARLARIIGEQKVDIIHARSRAPAWSAHDAARRTGARFVTTVHGPYSCGGLKRWYNGVMAKGDRIIAISEFIADYLQQNYRVGAPRVRVIHRGIDLVQFDPARVDFSRMVKLAQEWRLPDGVPVVMLPGRLTRWKGQTVLIDALAKLGRKDICALIVGSDQGRVAYREELVHRAERAGLGSTVRLLPDCRDMPAAYMLADVVVSASTDPEAFGRVAAEAQAMGRPVIATDHGAAKETVIPSETGWLTPPGDAAALAEAIDFALSLDADQRATLAETARAHIAENFTRERMCAMTLDVYAETLALPAREAAE